jgi:hypothetical protein
MGQKSCGSSPDRSRHSVIHENLGPAAILRRARAAARYADGVHLPGSWLCPLSIRTSWRQGRAEARNSRSTSSFGARSLRVIQLTGAGGIEAAFWQPELAEAVFWPSCLIAAKTANETGSYQWALRVQGALDRWRLARPHALRGSTEAVRGDPGEVRFRDRRLVHGPRDPVPPTGMSRSLDHFRVFTPSPQKSLTPRVAIPASARRRTHRG